MSVKNAPQRSEEDVRKAQGNWTFLLLLLSIILFAAFSHLNLFTLGRDILAVYMGGFRQVETISLLTAGITVLQLVAVKWVISILTIFVIKPQKEMESHSGFLGLFQNGPGGFYLTILMEEAFRYLFVGLIAMKWLHAGPFLTIGIMLIGNALWALAHLKNYKNPADRKIRLVLPQFLSGLIYFYIFVRYGFFITLIVHLTFDILAFSTEKTQNSTTSNIVNLVYWLIIGGICWFLMSQLNLTFAPIITWFTSTNLIKPELGIFQIALIITAIDAILLVISNFLFMDEISVPNNTDNVTPSLGDWLVASAGIAAIYIGIIFGITWILSHWITNAYTIAVVTTLIMIFLSGPKSGSSMAKLWFFSAPTFFISTFIVLTFGFWPALAILAINFLINMVPNIFMYY